MTIIELLEKLVAMDGSDLHIIAGLHPAVRVDGQLIPLTGYEELTPSDTQELVYSILTEEQKETFESDKEDRYELDFAYSVSGLGRFRCNIHKQRGTVAASVRALATHIPKLKELGLPHSVQDFATARKGLVLVAGPTGSGKSTTLAALIDTINSTRCDHIITVEDPIEYLHNSKKSYISQREVGFSGDTLSFKNALKFALRQDPDVILIGEMRDYETIGIALTSAERGHLVFGPLHTSGVVETVNRVIDIFPAEQHNQVRAQFASNLVGVISQILLPRINGRGRCVACEVMKTNAAIRNNIRSGTMESLHHIIETSTSEGMQTMDQSLLKLCQEGKIDYDSARSYVCDKTVEKRLQQYQRPGRV
ncbi:MAG: type IV pilus twitching motility protein PilT [Gemmatimonadota bacterium]|nr:MAG: type IV pilus twitching motility protein PilT [Gemmatimonadota bacterium]